MRGRGRKQIWKKKSTEADADHGKDLGDSDSVKRQQISFPEYSWEFVKRSSYGSFMGVSYESYLICIEFLFCRNVK